MIWLLAMFIVDAAPFVLGTIFVVWVAKKFLT